MAQQWRDDILGGGFEQLTLELAPDSEGEVVATLVRAPAPFLGGFGRPLRGVDVLYVHGWSDYFFQVELARAWTALGARFYALDLRKYGRSLRKGQTPGYVTTLATYDEDIAAAREAMGSHGRRLALMGHSTGGLTLTQWASRHPGEADALVLNSPWLELQVGALGREALAPLVQMRARYDPMGNHPVVDEGLYTRAQREIGSLPGGAERNTWRPDRGFRTYPAWFAAILSAQADIARGAIDVDCPALVMLSTRSMVPVRWEEQMTSADSVLAVEDVARAALKIGRYVTIGRIDGAVHDVFLSWPEPRARAFATLETWARAHASVGWALPTRAPVGQQ